MQKSLDQVSSNLVYVCCWVLTMSWGINWYPVPSKFTVAKIPSTNRVNRLILDHCCCCRKYSFILLFLPISNKKIKFPSTRVWFLSIVLYVSLFTAYRLFSLLQLTHSLPTDVNRTVKYICRRMLLSIGSIMGGNYWPLLGVMHNNTSLFAI